MIRNNVDILDSEVRFVVKRLDVDGDTHISFIEFKRFFQFPLIVKETSLNDLSTSNNYNTRSTFYNSCSPKRYDSPMDRSLNQSFNRSMNRTMNRSLSPNRILPIRSHLSPQRNLNTSLNRSIDRTTTSPDRFRTTSMSRISNHTYNYLSIEEENFVSFLRNVIEIENDIEKVKLDLILRSDFNADDAFRIFELDARGYLTDLDFKFGLNSLDVFPTVEEITLLLRRYDLRGEGVLR